MATMLRTPRRVTLTCCVVAQLGLAACADSERYAPVDIVWRGETIDLAHGPQATLCGGSAKFSDQMAGLLLDELGGSGERIRYFLLTDEELSKVPDCGDHLARCSVDGWVYTAFGVDEHELVHATRQVALGTPVPGPIALEEGLAEFHSGHATRHPIVPERLGALLADPGSPPDFEFYPTLAHYSGFLADSFGLADTMEFVEQARGATTFEQLDPAFQSVFGEPQSGALQRYEDSYPRCSEFDLARHELACSIEPRPWREDATAWADLTVANLSCEAETTLGPRRGTEGDEVWTYLTIDVQDEGFYSVTTPSGANTTGTTARLTACGVGCAADPATLGLHWTGEFSDQIFLVPGRYLVKLSRPLTEPGPAGFELRRSPL